MAEGWDLVVEWDVAAEIGVAVEIGVVVEIGETVEWDRAAAEEFDVLLEWNMVVQ
jgi:hypothetical protein